MDFFWFVLGGAALLVALLIGLYNRLVALRQKRYSAFSDIDVQLKQRFDMVPQLVETVKGYAAHEKSVLDQVTQARAQVDHAQTEGERASAEGVLSGAMMHLFAVAENYPDLKASQNFQQLQTELASLENNIAAARRYLNNVTSEYNAALEQFPAVLFARTFGFVPLSFFELSDDDAQKVHDAPSITF